MMMMIVDDKLPSTGINTVDSDELLRKHRQYLEDLCTRFYSTVVRMIDERCSPSDHQLDSGSHDTFYAA